MTTATETSQTTVFRCTTAPLITHLPWHIPISGKMQKGKRWHSGQDGLRLCSKKTEKHKAQIKPSGKDILVPHGPSLTEQALDTLSDLVRRGNAEALQVAFDHLRVERDDNGGLIKADLLLPCPSSEDEAAAKELLDPNRPKRRSRDQTEESDHRPQRYVNSYRLISIEPVENGLPKLRFRIAERIEREITRGPRAGKTVQKVDTINSQILQMIVVRWFRLKIFAMLPTPVRQGLGQEVAQQILSFLGLEEEGSQETGTPSVDSRDLTEVDVEYKNLLTSVQWNESPDEVETLRRWRQPKPQTIRFIASDSAVVWQHQTMDGGFLRKRLCVFLPIFAGISADSPLVRFRNNPELFRWHEHLDEFSVPFAQWKTVSRTKKINGNTEKVRVERRLDASLDSIIVPLSTDDESRFVGWLKSGYQVSWSILSKKEFRKGNRGKGKRRAVWLFQLIVRRPVKKPTERANLLGLAFIRKPLPNGDIGSFVDWAFCQDGIIKKTGWFLVDRIPMHRVHPGPNWRDRRKMQAVMVARQIANLSARLDADIALQDIGYVPKRSKKDPAANVEASRWNYAMLAKLIADKGAELPRPVSVRFKVFDALLKEVPDDNKAVIVAMTAWAKTCDMK